MGRAGRWLAGALLATACAAVGLELYARAPAYPIVAPLDVPAGTRVLGVLFHGSGGGGEPKPLPVAQHPREMARAGPGGATGPYSDSRLRARANGLVVGAALGREAATVAGLDVVHLVGHSAGAFPVTAFCDAYRAAASPRARLVLTYLDPIGFSGAFDPGWGARHYGGCADYAEAVISTDDAVPATNTPLAAAWNVDVTRDAGRAAAGLDGHVWPVRWYLERLAPADVAGEGYDHAARPRGAVTTPR